MPREANHVADGVLHHHGPVVVVADLALVLNDRDVLRLNHDGLGAPLVQGVDGLEPKLVDLFVGQLWLSGNKSRCPVWAHFSFFSAQRRAF